MIWVAEIGSAHNGSKAQAYEMIRQAKLAGATIAKFQLGWTEEAQMKYAGNINPVRYIDLWAEDLSHWCNMLGIEFMASIWSNQGLQVARGVNMKRYKIAHQIPGNSELVAEMQKDKKPLFWSGNRLVTDTFGIYGLYCTPDYPQYPPIEMPEKFDKYYGYSSHMHGYADALIAVARGAEYIEKHVTLNKADTTLRDNAFALSFDEFGEMVRIGEQMAVLR